MINTRTNVNDNKHMRDNTRLENKELKLKQGFTTSRMLIKDYESRKEVLDGIRVAIAEYQAQYSILLEQMNTEKDFNQVKSFKNMFKNV